MSLLYNKKPLVVNADLAALIGLNEAIVLQQIHYWSNETRSGLEHNGHRWIYNTYEQWQVQFPFWSVDTIKRTLTALKKANLIFVEQLNKSKHDRTNFYAINHEKVSQLSPVPSADSAPVDQGKLPPSSDAKCPDLTEITTENTAEITTKPLNPIGSSPDEPPAIDGEFEQAWSAYPKRAGSNPKNKALSAWKARRKEGVPAAAMIQGVKNYAAHCQASGKIHTEFVMQAARFFGTGREWETVWTLTAPEKQTHHALPSSYEGSQTPDDQIGDFFK